MTRIEKCFKNLNENGRSAFIAYITAGDPSWEKTAEIILELEKSGADIIELGVPFSDPMADGPVIQQASERALKNGITLKKILAGLKELRKSSEIPVLIFSYYNPIHRMGLKAFAEQAKDSGADGALITDLTPESAQEYKSIMSRAGLNTVFLAAPTTPAERLKKIATLCSGFVYYISRTGVTGIRKEMEHAASSRVMSIKALTSLPVAVGFGVSQPKHVASVASYADGVVVGSAIVKKIEETNGDARKVGLFVKELVAGIRA